MIHLLPVWNATVGSFLIGSSVAGLIHGAPRQGPTLLIGIVVAVIGIHEVVVRLSALNKIEDAAVEILKERDR